MDVLHQGVFVVGVLYLVKVCFAIQLQDLTDPFSRWLWVLSSSCSLAQVAMLTVICLLCVLASTPGVNLSKCGKWAVVTGSTDGIGKEYALQLAAKGLNIVLLARNGDLLREVAQEIGLPQCDELSHAPSFRGEILGEDKGHSAGHQHGDARRL